MNLPTQNISEVKKDSWVIIEETKHMLAGVRKALVYVAANLHFLRENDNRPWAEVCEDLDISQGFSSKLVASYQRFVLEGGIPMERLEGIDMERLYLASKTEGTPEEQLAKAETLTRGELRLSYGDDKPHAFEEYPGCKICGVSRENHDS